MPNFWKLPNGKLVASIFRCGSTTIARRILVELYPDQAAIWRNVKTPAGQDEALVQLGFIPDTRDPEDGAWLMGVIRDPIERFRSGYTRAARQRNGQVLTVDQLIAALQTAKPFDVNKHIRRFTDDFADWLPRIHWYRLERDMDQFAADCGFDGPFDFQNESEPTDKPTLTDAQTAALAAYYAADLAVYNAVTEAGVQVAV